MSSASPAKASAPTPIRIFRPGTFQSVEGVAVSFGVPELQAIADAYDPASDPAPLVIGHPVMDDPAYGWVERLAVEGGELVAHPDKIEPSFAEGVRSGRYRRVSAQFYTPDHPHNPKPGTHYLKHIGFLGAHPPGVKGLGTVSLAASADGELVTIPCNQETTMSDAPDATQIASFAEREAALIERETALAKRESDIAAAAKAARHAEHVSFAEGLVTEAKLAPAGKALLIGVLDQLSEQAAAVSFGEGDANQMTPVTALKKLLDGAQPLVSLGEFAGKDKVPGSKLASFAAPRGYDVDPDQAALYSRARELQSANPKLGWMDAVRQAEVA